MPSSQATSRRPTGAILAGSGFGIALASGVAALLAGLGVTVAMALLGWGLSLLGGLVLGLASSRTVWRTLSGQEFNGAKRWLPVPAPPRPSATR